MKSKLIQNIIFLLPIVSILTAQPSFPNSPNQAPIGGLGLLAAAGGAIAFKKLINKKKK